MTRDELTRYSRHLLLPEVGLDGQERLKAARVLCVGAGGLGSPVALYLAAAGVGTLTLVDFDEVDLTNLHRQIIHGTPDIGRPKLDSARDRLRALNPHVTVNLHPHALDEANARELVETHDVIVDGSDNFPTRYLVNDACVLFGKPNVYGSIFRFEGQASVFGAPGGPCYRCLHPAPPPADLIPNCAQAGVLGVLPGIIGTIQATETIKLVLQRGTPLVGRFLIFDALRLRFRELQLRRDPDCPACGSNPSIRELRRYLEHCAGAATEPASTISVDELSSRMATGAALIVLDVREQAEFDICRIPGSRLIPLGELRDRLDELDPAVEIIVHCKTGARSARATALLQDRGYRARNMQGGILAWLDQVDPSQPKY
jgi:molybdopterin/thiamine biosynthesis adenylyltransferase/rhodanese-related sulfurtransferase